MCSAGQVLAARLAAQRLVGEQFGTVADAVASLLGVQAQDPQLSRFSLALRAGCPEGPCQIATDAQIQAALSVGEVVRTHVLRPTWHYVHRDDLIWLLELTGPRTISSMAGRHRQLGIDAVTQQRAFEVLSQELGGHNFRTRAQLTALLPHTSYPRHGDVVGHLLMLAELSGLICSGPLIGSEHSYALVSEVIPATNQGSTLTRVEAVDQLVHRFLLGHGPASLSDLKRWWPGAKVSELRPALLAHQRVTVEGAELFTAAPIPDHSPEGAWLLPTFDEAFLPFDQVSWARDADHPLGVMRLNAGAAGGGHVLVGERNRGVWKRTLTGSKLIIRLTLEAGLTAAERAQIETVGEQLRQFHQVERLVWTTG